MATPNPKVAEVDIRYNRIVDDLCALEEGHGGRAPSQADPTWTTLDCHEYALLLEELKPVHAEWMHETAVELGEMMLDADRREGRP